MYSKILHIYPMMLKNCVDIFRHLVKRQERHGHHHHSHERPWGSNRPGFGGSWRPNRPGWGYNSPGFSWGFNRPGIGGWGWG
ncbi:hypothetical protein Q1695_013610 [Nippostrongylus brasiliensis]|nr:hypothetical protein Q1695_013610 [Nippostrongylus brasiliensis]